MIHSFLFDLDAAFIVLLLFFLMLFAIWFGYKIGLKKTKTDNKILKLVDSNKKKQLLSLYLIKSKAS